MAGRFENRFWNSDSSLGKIIEYLSRDNAIYGQYIESCNIPINCQPWTLFPPNILIIPGSESLPGASLSLQIFRTSSQILKFYDSQLKTAGVNILQNLEEKWALNKKIAGKKRNLAFSIFFSIFCPKRVLNDQ